MTAPTPAYFELVEFIAAGTTPEAIIAFRPSQSVQDRVSDLMEKKATDSLRLEEESELEDFLQIEHILIMAKAHARRHLSVGE